ncbi:MAG: phage portal protein [Bryobacteraceae bacterium]
MKSAEVFLLDSDSGAIARVNAPGLIAALYTQAEFHQVQKAAGENSGSRRLRQKYGITIDGVQCASRPFDFYTYAYATTLSTYHARAVRAKARDIAGGKWKITGDGPLRDEIAGWFRSAFPRLRFKDGLVNVWTDYEALGNGYLEVIPDKEGKPAQLAHVPATEVWVRLDGNGFVQQLHGEYSHFKLFGVPDEELPEALVAKAATAIMPFHRYMPWSPFYGVPSIMPAWNAVALTVLCAEYNLHFFSNNAIPDYAVLLEGDWPDDAEDLIREYFRTHLKGQHHKTLALKLPQGNKITFERLTSDGVKEGGFRLLRQDCRDEIIHAHGVPPQKVGIVETGKLGGNLASEQRVEYKDSIVAPGQERLSDGLNAIIQARWETEEYRFEFEPLNVEDQRLNAEIDERYLRSRVVTPNEVRSIRFPDREPLEGGDEPLSSGPALDPLADQALQQMQQEVRAAIAREAEV